ncbi:MAG: transketolase C-terminal domain-containing protein [Planctomycetota bacterium]
MMRSESVREAYGQALVELGQENQKVVVLDADVSNSTRSVLFGRKFPERFFNVGIAEANMMSMAAGMAACGKIPFANTFSFLAALRAADCVRSLIAYNNLDVKIAGAYSGLSDSKDGPSHQSICDIAIMRSLPNMTVVVVADAYETKIAVKKVADYKGPVFLRLSRAELPVIFDQKHKFEIGKGNLLKQGKDVSIIAVGYMVHKSLEAAKILADKGADAEVIEIHTIKPIDKDIIIKSAKKTAAVVTAEEHSVIGGLGSAVAEVLVNSNPTRIEFIGIKDTFAESGEYEPLLSKYGLDASSIAKASLNAMSQERK